MKSKQSYNRTFANKIKKLLLLAYCFLYVFYPPFTTINTMYGLAAIAYIYIIFNYKKFIAFMQDVRIVKYVGLMAVAVYYLFLMRIVNGDGQLGITKAERDFVYLVLMALPISFHISSIIINIGCDSEDLLRLLMLVGNIQGIFSLISFLSPSFHNWMLQKLILYGFEEARFTSLAYYRLNGLAFHLTNYAPLVASLLIVYALYYSKRNIYYLSYIPLMGVFILLNSRTPVVMVIIGAIFVLVATSGRDYNINREIILVGFLVGLALFAVRFILLQQGTWYGGWVKYGYETVLSFFTGDYKGYSAYITNDQIWRIPSDVHLLTGYGSLSTNNSPYLSTDVGYIRYLWAGGLIYLALIVIINKGILSCIASNPKLPLLANIVFIFLLINNVKDTMFSANEFMMIVILLFVFTVLETSRNKRKLS